jgi:uncharacterized secreted protein with C-terminal beta-propeller domain
VRYLVFASLVFFINACGNETPNADLDLDISASRSFGSPLLRSYDSCAALKNDLKRAALDEMHTQMKIMAKESGGPRIMVDKAAGAPVSGAAPEAAKDSSLVEGKDFSGSNNQEKGIDEADIVKFDGNYFYLLNKSTLEIVAAPEAGKLSKASTVSLESAGSALLVVDDLALVFSEMSTYESDPLPISALKLIPNFDNRLRVDIIDLGSDRKNPKVLTSHYVDGNFVTARKIGDNIHIASYLYATIPGIESYPSVPDNFWELSEKERAAIWTEAIKKRTLENEKILNDYDFLKLLPARLSKSKNTFERNEINAQDCATSFGAENTSSNGFLSLITLRPTKDIEAIDIQRVRGNMPIVYASKKQFILASQEYQPWWYFGGDLLDQSIIHRFDLSEISLPTYVDSVRIPGSINNSFSLSEYDGYLRVATTTTIRSDPFANPELPVSSENAINETNSLFIIGDQNADFSVVSSIEDLAPNERIWSARFTNDKGFLVTFKQMDPLFTLDLSDPLNPKVAGELKIPGVSTYLQDIGDNHLLAVGYGGDEEKLDFNTTISLFDTSDFAKPKLKDSLSFALSEGLDNSWSTVSSEANQSHLAINYFAPAQLTAIPLNTNRFTANPLDPQGGRWEYITKLTLVNTNFDSDLTIRGEINHSSFYNKKSSYLDFLPQIRRSYFLKDYIYAISPKAITAHNLNTMEQTAVYELAY